MNIENDDCAALDSGVVRGYKFPDIFLSLAEVAARLAYVSRKKDVEKPTRTVFRSDLSAKEVPSLVRGGKDCVRLMEASADETLSKTEFTKGTLPSKTIVVPPELRFTKNSALVFGSRCLCAALFFLSANCTGFHFAWRIRLRGSRGGWWK